MSLFKLGNVKNNYLAYVVNISLFVWISLIISSFFINDGAEKISELAAKIEFFVHFLTLSILIIICKKLDSKDDKKEIYWIFSISLMLFAVDFCFYIAAYASESFLLKLTVFQFFLYYFPCIMGCLMMIIFVAKILLKDVLNTGNFLKTLGGLALMNIITMGLFLSSIHYAFKVISWDTISQIFTLIEELIMFDFAILGLIYAQKTSAFLLLSGMIVLVASDYFLTYSYISQTVKLFSYGELLWLLGLLLILFAVVYMKQYQDYSVKSWFNKSNKIKSRLAFWTFLISASGFLLFFIFAYTFKIVDKSIFVGLPLFFMMFSVIAVVLSIWIGKNFELPFKQIKHNIQALMLDNKIEKIDENFTIDEFIFLQKYIIETYNLKEEKDKIKKKLGDVATQVAHDIRSPLAALDSILQDLSQLPEEKRVITRNAIGRIRDIANNLLIQNRNEKEIPAEVKLCLLTSLIDTLVSEKRLQFRSELNVHIEFTPTICSYGLFAKVDVPEFKRVLSNLINNAVEALQKSGEVRVELGQVGTKAIIQIKDNGPGMPFSIIEKLGETGNTLGKIGGSGLGLAHAVQSMKLWNGSIKIDSKPKEGTVINLHLPLAQPAAWFLTGLTLEPNSRVLVLDDDTTIHQIWDDRFTQAKEQGIEIQHFSNKASLADWLASHDINEKPCKVLCDYEIIGYQETGLDIIESLNLAPYSILVTSRYEQPEIQARCEKLGIHLLPKALALLVPITIKPKARAIKQLYDLVLLDDDELVRSTWQMCAISNKQKIALAENSAALKALLPQLSKNTLIYLDYSLAEEETGADIAKTLYEQGYDELYLATGYEGQAGFAKPEWVKAVVSKKYPL